MQNSPVKMHYVFLIFLKHMRNIKFYVVYFCSSSDNAIAKIKKTFFSRKGISVIFFPFIFSFYIKIRCR